MNWVGRKRLVLTAVSIPMPPSTFLRNSVCRKQALQHQDTVVGTAIHTDQPASSCHLLPAIWNFHGFPMMLMAFPLWKQGCHGCVFQSSSLLGLSQTWQPKIVMIQCSPWTLPCREVNPPFWTNPDSVFFPFPQSSLCIKIPKFKSCFSYRSQSSPALGIPPLCCKELQPCGSRASRVVLSTTCLETSGNHGRHWQAQDSQDIGHKCHAYWLQTIYGWLMSILNNIDWCH